MKFIIDHLLNFLNSFGKFVRASIVSLIVIAIIFLLLTKLEQAYVMIIDLVETSSFDLVLSHFLILALAISLSHYPIYTYYAGNINQSKVHFSWYQRKIRWIPFAYMYIFERKKKECIKDSSKPYKIDRTANFLRYSIGFTILAVWLHIFWKSFLPNLKFETSHPFLWESLSYFGVFLLWLLYIVLKNKATNYEEKNLRGKQLKMQVRLFFFFLISLVTTLTLILIVAIQTPFSKAGFLMIIFTIYGMICTYMSFRLTRSKFSTLHSALRKQKIIKGLVRIFMGLQSTEKYLSVLVFFAIISGLIVIYSIYCAITLKESMNGIPIVLAYLYLYSYLAMTTGKYFFVARLPLDREDPNENRCEPDVPYYLNKTWMYYARVIAIIIVVVLVIAGMNTEQNTHQLSTLKRTPDREMKFEEFKSYIESRDTLVFIASHGGGLKANAWTLLLMNEMHKQTGGNVFENTVALSGASGGSLGLSLYTALFKKCGDTVDQREAKIESIIHDNYTSVDLSLLFGPDSYRSVYPLNGIQGNNRTYYSMVRYQRHVEGNGHELKPKQFRVFWNEIFDNPDTYWPSLIMNTASIDGRRGILWSVQPKENTFHEIFHNAIDLAELNGEKTLPYYEATSLTNRFPVFSPSAKIKHYGHFIDAGAIDNSGLLGCLDLLNYFKRNYREMMKDKHIVFIEISNSKGLYVKKLLNDYDEDENDGKSTHWVGNEDESSTLSNDLSGGINLDKIPGYLEGYLKQMSIKNENVDYINLPLPYKITVDDVEKVLKGKLWDSKVEKLKTYLDKRNLEVTAVCKEENSGFFTKWDYYEPVLCRHLNQSAINYYHKILEHTYIKEQLKKIEDMFPKQ